MAIRNLVRHPTLLGTATPKAAPIYVDADDNRVKIVPAGSGSTEKVLAYSEAEIVTATRTLTAADADKVIFLNSATEFVTTLPAPTLGLGFTFIVKAAPVGASYTIVSAGAAEIIVGKVHSAAGDAGDVENTAGGTTITFVDGQAVIGDRVDVVSDGTLWYAIGYASVAAGITITG